MTEAHFYAVIPAGGSGTRLWPMSRAGRPKFLLDLAGAGRSLLQSTWQRLAPLAEADSVYVVSGAAHADPIRSQLPNLPAGRLLIEPAPRDSAPAIGLAAVLINRRDPDAVMGSFAADHLVRDEAAFATAVRSAIGATADGSLVTIGLTPTGPETGFGYIRCGALLGAGPARRAEEFKEKPSAEAARRYVDGGGYLWNASMFLWRAAAFLEELRLQQPELAAGLDRIADAWDSSDRGQTLRDVWALLPRTNVDQGVMEDAARRGRVAIVPADLGWDDVGDWDTVARVGSGDSDGVTRIGDGDVVALDTTGTLVASTSGRLVATVGVDDLVVVDTPDAVLVCRRDHAQRVKAMVDELKAGGREELV